MFDKEKRAIEALSNYSKSKEFEWLKKYKELYYWVVLQPPGLPPIRRPGNTKLENEFYELYSEVLDSYMHDWDYDRREITLLSSYKLIKTDKLL